VIISLTMAVAHRRGHAKLRDLSPSTYDI
jgi:hypothetical protein